MKYNKIEKTEFTKNKNGNEGIDDGMKKNMKRKNCPITYFAQSAGAVEYTDCTSAEG